MFKLPIHPQGLIRGLVAFYLVSTFLFHVTESAAQIKAGLLRTASPTSPIALGNPFPQDDGTSSRVALFDGLTSFSRDAKLEPALATSWQSDGQTTWTFNLRDNVEFHNGVPFTAQAVAATIEYLMSPEGLQFYVAKEVATIESVDVIDPLTVAITTKGPDPILPNRLASVSIVEPGAWAELGPAGFAQTPVGTGPYALEDWGTATRTVIYTAFEKSWRAPKDVKRVELRALPDATTRLQALITGQVDIAVNLDPDNIPQLDAGGFNTIIMPAPHIVSIALRNTGEVAEPLKDKRVRQALNYAVNKRIMAEQILNNNVRVPSQAVTPEVFGFNPALKPYSYDPEKARSLLIEAGYGDGIELTFGVFSGQTPADTLLFQLMQQDLRNVGVNATLRMLPFPDLMRRISSGEWGEIDAYSTTLSSARLGDASQAIEFMSCAYPRPFFCDPDAMSIFEESNREMDPARREVLLQETLTQYHDLAPNLLLVDYSAVTGTSTRVGNYKARSNGVRFEEILLAD